MDLHISLAAEVLFHVGPIPVTNSMLTMFIVMAVVLIVFIVVAKRAQSVPGRGQSIIEMIVEFILNLVEGTAGKTFGRRVMPLISALFIFILFANLSGLIPGMGTIGINREEPEAAPATEVVVPVAGGQAQGTTTNAEAPHAESSTHTVLVPFFRAPTADLNMTLALALLAFGVVQVIGVRSHGFGGRIKHMADPPFLFPIEVISEFSRIISLSARLFGNVFAGEILLGVMYAMAAAIKIAIVPFLFPVLFMFLEVLFGTIQALVFALLTLIYLVLASGGGDDHAEAHAAPSSQDAHPGAVPVPSGD